MIPCAQDCLSMLVGHHNFHSLFMKLISQRGQRTSKVMACVIQIGCIFIIIPGHYEVATGVSPATTVWFTHHCTIG